jgi:crooked neck
LLLEAWKDFEENYGDEDTKAIVKAKMPKVVKKRRAAYSTEDNIIWEEYFDYIFADDETAHLNSCKWLKLGKQR